MTAAVPMMARRTAGRLRIHKILWRILAFPRASRHFARMFRRARAASGRYRRTAMLHDRARQTVAWLLLLCTLIAPILASAGEGTRLTAWRLGQREDGTRFVLELSDPARFTVSYAARPDRLIIDLAAPDLVAPARLAPEGLVRGAEIASTPQGVSRVSLRLSGPARLVRAFQISPSEGKGPRLVFDVAPTTRAAFDANVKTDAAPAGEASERVEPAVVPSAPAKTAGAPTRPIEVPAAPSAPAPLAAGQDLPRGAAPAETTIGSGPVDPANGARPVGAPPAPAPLPPPATAPTPTEAARLSQPQPEAAPPTFDPQPAEAAPAVRRAEPGKPVSVTVPIIVMPPATAPSSAADPSSHDPGAAPAERRSSVVPEDAAKVTTASTAAPDTRLLIALDPGHGGIDPGAVGHGGVLEKAITLSAARALEARLVETGRYRVMLTRNDDSFVRLRERVAKARAAGAALFVSLHADVYRDRRFGGLSVYSQSDEASDHQAAQLAAKENRVDALTGIDFASQPEAVGSILLDLAERETRERSARFATLVTSHLGDAVPLVPRARRTANFAVLTAPDVPSVLIELGYLSNGADMARLSSREGIDAIAQGISGAIDAFFTERPAIDGPTPPANLSSRIAATMVSPPSSAQRFRHD